MLDLASSSIMMGSIFGAHGCQWKTYTGAASGNTPPILRCSSGVIIAWSLSLLHSKVGLDISVFSLSEIEDLWHSYPSPSQLSFELEDAICSFEHPFLVFILEHLHPASFRAVTLIQINHVSSCSFLPIHFKSLHLHYITLCLCLPWWYGTIHFLTNFIREM